MVNSQTIVYISLGSNIDPRSNLISARDELFGKLNDAHMSPMYQSAAVGMSGADFLNSVVGGHSTRSLNEIKNMLQQIEQSHGRIRTDNKFTDRTLDLDILLYGNQVTDRLAGKNTTVLPHPEILQQAYVLQPLADIASDFIHPVCHQTINELCIRLKSVSPEKFCSLKRIPLAK